MLLIYCPPRYNNNNNNNNNSQVQVEKVLRCALLLCAFNIILLLSFVGARLSARLTFSLG
jgi:hypothetical protein